MSHNSLPKYSRRSMLTAGGAAAAGAAFLAACGGTSNTVTRLGSAPTTAKLTDAQVTDVVLLRTAQSVETMIATMMSDSAFIALTDSATAPIVASFTAAHKAHVGALASLITSRGGESYTGTNEKLMVSYGQQALNLVADGKDKQDVAGLALALESLSCATYQYFVSLTSDPTLRSQMMRIGATSARRAAVVAQLINSGTQAFAPGIDDKGVATIATLPNAFGALNATQVFLGPVNPESGTRASLLLDTPSLNSLIY